MSGALKFQLRGVKMMGRLRLNAKDDKGETVTHFLRSEGRRGTAQGAVVM
jgi:hypothetical protein